jgi:hypothetical protein
MRRTLQMVEQALEANPCVEASKQDLRDKGGGLRKRRTAYSSGRRELFGWRRKRPGISLQDIQGLVKKKRKKSKRLLSRLGLSSKHRWRTY